MQDSPNNHTYEQLQHKTVSHTPYQSTSLLLRTQYQIILEDGDGRTEFYFASLTDAYRKYEELTGETPWKHKC